MLESSEDEGFQSQKHQLVPYHSQLFKPEKTLSKYKKMIFKPPKCIFYQINLISPQIGQNQTNSLSNNTTRTHFFNIQPRIALILQTKKQKQITENIQTISRDKKHLDNNQYVDQYVDYQDKNTNIIQNHTTINFNNKSNNKSDGLNIVDKELINKSHIKQFAKDFIDSKKIRIIKMDNPKQSLKISQYFFDNQDYSLIYNKFNKIITKNSQVALSLTNVSQIIRMEMLKNFSESSFKGKNNTKNSINFCSEFESGNLSFVLINKNINNTYHLLIENDTNSHGYTQWFYFGCRSLTIRKCRFVIMNIAKKLKFVNGMKLFSFTTQKGWNRNVQFTYYKNNLEKEKGGSLYSIDFQYQFTDANTMVFFTLNYPYTYTKLTNYLQRLNKKQHYYGLQVKIMQLGQSEVKNGIPCIKISKEKQIKINYKKQRQKCIIVVGRQHPCETVSSFICEKMIESLLHKNNKNSELLNSYNWYFIPMVNPDGVIHGHSRTNIKGYDTNRCWDKFSKNKSIEVDHITKFIAEIHNKENIFMVIDLHGHSFKFGSFCYFAQNNEFSKILTYHLCQSQLFNKTAFQWGLPSSKRLTCRGNTYRRYGIINSLTIQTSFYGYQKDQDLIPYTQKHFNEIGQAIINSIWQHQNYRISEDYELKEKIKQKLKQFEGQIKYYKQKETFEESDSSNPEEDYLNSYERQVINEKNMTKQKQKQKLIETKLNDKNFSELNIKYQTTTNKTKNNKINNPEYFKHIINDFTSTLTQRQLKLNYQQGNQKNKLQISQPQLYKPPKLYTHQNISPQSLCKRCSKNTNNCQKCSINKKQYLKGTQYEFNRQSSLSPQQITLTKNQKTKSSNLKNNLIKYKQQKTRRVIYFKGDQIISDSKHVLPLENGIPSPKNEKEKNRNFYLRFINEQKYKSFKKRVYQIRNKSGFHKGEFQIRCSSISRLNKAAQ